MKAQPRCPMKHANCFARTILGRCTALEDVSFSGRPCPFFKPEEQLCQERTASLRTLKAAGRMDLIEQYSLEPNPKSVGKGMLACV